MKKLVLFLSLLCIGTVVMAEQVNVPGPKNFQGDVYLAGTKITATAAEINALDGITATVAQLNQAGAKAALTLTNATLSVTYTTNIWNVLDINTNAVALTNITPAVSITVSR